MSMWNPWRGCHKYSEGCKYCYIHKGDIKREIDTSNVVKTDEFNSPIAKLKSGAYKIKSGQMVFLCFFSDFLIEDADEWRPECWKMIKERSDLHFLFLKIRKQCFEHQVNFEFRQCGTHFVKDGVEYTLNVRTLCSQARKANIDYHI